MRRRAALSYAGATLLGAAVLSPGSTGAQPLNGTRSGAQAREDETVDYHEWADKAALAQGRAEGVRVTGAGLLFEHPTGRRDYGGHRYESATWTSPTYRPSVAASEIVSSWNAHTPPGTWLEVGLRVTDTQGRVGGWYVMGDWAFSDADIKRTSVDGQSDAVGSISTDTFVAGDGGAVAAYQLRVRLYRPVGTHAGPSVWRLGAMASRVPDRFEVPASTPGVARGVELRVPRYSQDVHKGDFPQYGGGGESWCSPTSTEMVVEYWGKRPSAAELAWVGAGHPDPTVDYAARYTYDKAYDGTGNWPFNTAYAAHYGLAAHVTRLRTLNELERYVKRGIPVVTSQSFETAELPGAGYGTSGHLMVVVGFTDDGDVIANDPASPNDAAVRHVYPRHAFETIWLRTKRHTSDGSVASGSGGAVYLIRPRGMRLR